MNRIDLFTTPTTTTATAAATAAACAANDQDHIETKNAFDASLAMFEKGSSGGGGNGNGKGVNTAITSESEDATAERAATDEDSEDDDSTTTENNNCVGNTLVVPQAPPAMPMPLVINVNMHVADAFARTEAEAPAPVAAAATTTKGVADRAATTTEASSELPLVMKKSEEPKKVGSNLASLDPPELTLPDSSEPSAAASSLASDEDAAEAKANKGAEALAKLIIAPPPASAKTAKAAMMITPNAIGAAKIPMFSAPPPMSGPRMVMKAQAAKAPVKPTADAATTIAITTSATTTTAASSMIPQLTTTPPMSGERLIKRPEEITAKLDAASTAQQQQQQSPSTVRAGITTKNTMPSPEAVAFSSAKGKGSKIPSFVDITTINDSGYGATTPTPFVVMPPADLTATSPTTMTANTPSIATAAAGGTEDSASAKAVLAAESIGHKRALASGEAHGQITVPELGRIEVRAQAADASSRIDVHVHADDEHAKHVIAANLGEMRSHVRIEVPNAIVHAPTHSGSEFTQDRAWSGASNNAAQDRSNDTANNSNSTGGGNGSDRRRDDAREVSTTRQLSSSGQSSSQNVINLRGRRVRFVL